MSITAKSFIFKFFSAMAVVTALVLSTVASSTAKNEMPQVVTDWFEALRTANKGKFEELLSSDAVVDVRFLGITQTKSEYIAALDSWVEIAGDVQIRTSPINVRAERVEMEVCYTFSRNKRLNRESFDIKDGKITRNVQEMVGENC